MTLKILVAILLLVVTLPGRAEGLYLSASSTWYKHYLGLQHTAAANLGYVAGPLDLSGGMYDSTLHVDRGGSFHSNGRIVLATLHQPIAERLSAFAGLQWNDVPGGIVAQRWGGGVGLHYDPVKILLIYSPRQSDYSGATPYNALGVSVSLRHGIGG